VWILQTLPSIVVGLYTRWLHRWALLIGWAAGMVTGTLMATSQDFKTSVYSLDIFGIHIASYEAIFALVLNLVVTLVLTVVFAALGVERGDDETRDSEYEEIGEHRAAAAPAFTAPAVQE
jgi:solute:Na+ symporter, SSS family